jgi:hypothetical protein
MIAGEELYFSDALPIADAAELVQMQNIERDEFEQQGRRRIAREGASRPDAWEGPGGRSVAGRPQCRQGG